MSPQAAPLRTTVLHKSVRQSQDVSFHIPQRRKPRDSLTSGKPGHTSLTDPLKLSPPTLALLINTPHKLMKGVSAPRLAVCFLGKCCLRCQSQTVVGGCLWAKAISRRKNEAPTGLSDSTEAIIPKGCLHRAAAWVLISPASRTGIQRKAKKRGEVAPSF